MTGQSDNPRIDPGFPAGITAAAIASRYDLSGRTALVTGASSGLGFETARVLAARGACVVLGVRDLVAGEQAAQLIATASGASNVEVMHLDLGNLSQVRSAVEGWGDRSLDIVIANAGVMACPLSRTCEGHEMQFGVNHLGHFVLINGLMPALAQAGKSRVVMLSSGGHILGDIAYDDPDYDHRPYEPFEAYGQSKTATILFARELDKRARKAGIRAFSVNPGAVSTNLLRHMTPDILVAMGWSEGIPLDFQTPETGASTQVWAAIGTELDHSGGLYLENCREAPPIHPLPRPVAYSHEPSATSMRQSCGRSPNGW